ncbi:hypothetical protein D9756_005660 [Leucocoprinus leucothites]|uniref:Protein kinase domain-containing protein n=1 Tax=Leucocoprinus leucothites TaxID=201217 RepID=A0A8H5FZG8_9AGAR|nr:hypothetical protein D9756_005660 [Leucoagaricus leucothites]
MPFPLFSLEEEEARTRLLNFTNLASSFLARPSEFDDYAKDLVRNNRPFDFDAIPITLSQREMAESRDDCQLRSSAEAQRFPLHLTIAACKRHTDQVSRRSEIQELFQEDIHLRAETIPGTEFKTNGNLLADIIPPLIRECENEQGCALFKAIACYAGFLKTQVDCHKSTCFPSILMLDVGTCLAFYGCTWTGKRICVEPLTPWYDLATPWADWIVRRSIAASLSTLKITVKRLEAHYTQVPSLQPRGRAYPYPTSYVNEMGRKFYFKYVHRVPEKLLFMAGTERIGTLIVKFTRQYSAEARRLLASSNYAPTLRAAVSIPGGWTMVVMDLSPLRSLVDPELVLSVESHKRVFPKVAHIIETLHKGGFIHGDIRRVNILIDDKALEHNEEFAVHLLEFNWAGRIGQAKYPTHINTEIVSRPEGVTVGADITVDDDLRCLKCVVVIIRLIFILMYSDPVYLYRYASG